MLISKTDRTIYFTHNSARYSYGTSANIFEISLSHIIKLLYYKIVDIIEEWAWKCGLGI